MTRPPDAPRPFIVEITTPDRGVKTWDRYATRERAESICATLRAHSLAATVRKEHPPDSANESAAALAGASGAGDFDGTDDDQDTTGDAFGQQQATP